MPDKDEEWEEDTEAQAERRLRAQAALEKMRALEDAAKDVPDKRLLIPWPDVEPKEHGLPEPEVKDLNPFWDSYIANAFAYHPPVDDVQANLYSDNRNRFYDLAHRIGQVTKPCEEREQAVKCLREALMWANAAIACHGDNLPRK